MWLVFLEFIIGDRLQSDMILGKRLFSITPISSFGDALRASPRVPQILFLKVSCFPTPKKILEGKNKPISNSIRYCTPKKSKFGPLLFFCAAVFFPRNLRRRRSSFRCRRRSSFRRHPSTVPTSNPAVAIS
jgi:hypothetical protein